MSKRRFFSGNTLGVALMAAAKEFDLKPEEVKYQPVEKRHGFVNSRKRFLIEVDADDPRLEAPAGPLPAPTISSLPAPASPPKRPAEVMPEAEPKPRTVPTPRTEPQARTEPRARTEPKTRTEPKAHTDRATSESATSDEPAGEIGAASPADSGERSRGPGGRGRGRRGRGGRGGRDRKPAEGAVGEQGGKQLSGDARAEGGRAESRGSGDERSSGGGGRGGRGRGGRPASGSRDGGKQGAEGQRAAGGRGSEERGRGPKPSGGRGGDRGRGGNRGRGGDRGRRVAPRRRYREEPESQSELAEFARQALDCLLDLMRIDAWGKVYQTADRIEIDLEGRDTKLLLRHYGKGLFAMEHLMPKMIRSLGGELVPCRVDCDGFHEMREQELGDLAERTARQVISKGRPVTLDWLNPAERRIVHLALADNPDVYTESMGKGYLKRLSIRPADQKGEETQREAEGAGGDVKPRRRPRRVDDDYEDPREDESVEGGLAADDTPADDAERDHAEYDDVDDDDEYDDDEYDDDDEFDDDEDDDEDEDEDDDLDDDDDYDDYDDEDDEDEDDDARFT